jgi:pullulanase
LFEKRAKFFDWRSIDASVCLSAVYEGGGKIWQREDAMGIVFLAEDWDGSSLPMDLVEKSGISGSQFEPVDPWERAKLGGYAKIGTKVVFLLEPERFPFLFKRKDCKVFLASEWSGWEDARKDKCWQLDWEGENLCLWMNWEDLTHLGSFAFKFITDDGVWLDPPDPFPGVEEKSPGAVNFVFEPCRTGKDLVSFHITGSPESQRFDFLKRQRPKGEFGYRERSNGSWFRTYAPRAKQVDLVIIDDETEKVESVRPMIFQDDGSWTIEFPEKSTGRLYRLAITHHEHENPRESLTREALDPYALATDGRDGPGIALHPLDPVPSSEAFIPPNMASLVIAEAHLRDLLAQAPIELNEKERMEFRGLAKWLRSEDCYLRKLGVNAVELQPVLEFDSQSKEEYHWGYMPVSFMAPASAYASDPRNGSVILEFKELVAAFHDAGLAVILDVVYNHVGIPNHLALLDRELYFATDQIGRLTNHSGCGNDLNCESEPARKLVLDSVKYFVSTFDVDGFRFDLGELLGMELLREIETELREIKPGIILIAEPWSFRGRLPGEMNETGYSLWSDSCREGILEYVKEGCPKPRVALDLLQGKLDQENKYPWQSVNYLESHDDYAFIDRLCKASEWKDGKPPAGIEEKGRFALGLVLFSPGIPMLSAGQDFLRGKQGVRNTYLRGDLNALEYSAESKFGEFQQWIRDLIRFRLSKEGRFLRPESLEDFTYEEILIKKGGAFGLCIRDEKNSASWLILVNPTFSYLDVVQPAFPNLAQATLLFGKKTEKPRRIAPMDIQAWKLSG